MMLCILTNEYLFFRLSKYAWWTCYPSCSSSSRGIYSYCHRSLRHSTCRLTCYNRPNGSQPRTLLNLLFNWKKVFVHAPLSIGMQMKKKKKKFCCCPCSPSPWFSQPLVLLTQISSNRRPILFLVDVNKSLLNLHKLADGNDDPQLTDFIEGKYLEEQVQAVKKLADMVTQLNRVGDGKKAEGSA